MEYQSENKVCQNCKASFTIEPDDFSFYEKIGVPAPTFCPECRMIRRMSWRNERTWHKRVCPMTNKAILTTFPPQAPYIVYDQEYWKSDAFEALEYGRDYDFSKDYFTQFHQLLKDVPHPNLVQKNNVDCEYANYTVDSKNSYVVASAVALEDCAYCLGSVTGSKKCIDMHQCNDMESSYEVVDCIKCYQLFYSQNCEACSDSYFMYDCKNSSHCIGCVGLRSASYCIFNEQYTKEAWQEESKKLALNTREGFAEAEHRFEELKRNFPRKYAVITKAEACIGDDIRNARNCKYCFYARNNVENLRYTFKAFNNTKDGYDAVTVWDNTELFCECVSVCGQRVFFSQLIWGGFDIEYSYNCFDCNNIFGCVGLRNKSYCIFNKQYSPEEYKQLVFDIKNQMREIQYIDSHGNTYGYGEFLPSELSMYGYNESLAQEYFPVSKEEALSRGYVWQEPVEKKYVMTLKKGQLPAHCGDEILSDIIECAHAGQCGHGCSTAFKIVPIELSFYKEYDIPLPTLCSGCRHAERVAKKNPLKLWHRSCMCNQNGHDHIGKCRNEFETSYAPDRPEKVYCEACYNKEIL